MTPFRYHRAENIQEAIALARGAPNVQFIAGGTSQVDLMKEGVQRPTALIDISRIGMDAVVGTVEGGLSIGANVTNAAASDHPLLRQRYPAIAEALHSGASQQIRNVASMAGNLLQRTRCPYLRDPEQACNKRDRGSGCAAVEGFNRLHAIIGQTHEGARDARTCIAVHPSDLAVALAAHDAVVVLEGRGGERRIAFDTLHRLPDGAPERDTILEPDDVITAIELPRFTGRSHYLKVRDRASYAYALVSCAVALDLDGDRITRGRVVLGSVAHKPWRLHDVEKRLAGARPSVDLFRSIAAGALTEARSHSMNGYKVQLSRALIERGLLETSGLEPLAGPPGTALAASVGGLATNGGQA